MKRRGFRSIFFLLTLGLAGCGSGGLAPVTGSVTYQGKPATGASVHFHREGATDEEAVNFPIGIVDADGTFELVTSGVGKGAVPGKYIVLVIWPPEKSDAPPTSRYGETLKRKDPRGDSDRLNFRYFQASKPLLTAEVKAESNKLGPFELKD